MSVGTLNKFKLNGKVAVVTGGAGLLGVNHAEIIAEAGGIPVLWDIQGKVVKSKARRIVQSYGVPCLGMKVDITHQESTKKALKTVLNKFSRLDILINNAANDPKVSRERHRAVSRLENFTMEAWEKDLAVGLTGAFLCSQVLGTHMARNGGGVILNVASDLGIIAPDQRIYRKKGLKEAQQPVKPVTYSVIKHGVIGLTKYLATYWAEKNVRANAISPGGVYMNQPKEFVQRLTDLIPLGRMAQQDEYKAAVLFLISDASGYMTGSNLVIDGGRTCW